MIIDNYLNIKNFIRIYTYEFLANKSVVLSTTIGGLVLPITIQTLTWNYIFSNNTEIKYYTFSQIFIYICITVLLMVTDDSEDIISNMSERIKDGSIDTYKVKPISNFNLILLSSIGRNYIIMLSTFLILAIFTLIYNYSVTVPVLILYLFSQFLVIQMAYVFSLFCYWFINNSFINYLFYLVTQIFGGFLIPIDLWPEPFQSILRYNPFRIIISAIPDIILNPSTKNITTIFFLAIFYNIFFIFIIKFLEEITIKNYNSQGG